MKKIDLEQILLDKAVAYGKPFKATLELTPLCNLNCEMCYIRHTSSEVEKKGGVLPLSFWEKIISQLKNMGVLVVSLIGGEPFLHPDIERIYTMLVENGFLVNITTNGTLLAKEIPDWIRNNPPRYVTVSLYGSSNKTYHKVCGQEKGFSMAIRGIENLLAENIDVKLNFMITPNNKTDLDKLFDIKRKYNLPLLATAYSHPANRKERGEVLRMSAEECAEYEMKVHYLSDPDHYECFCRKMSTDENYLNQTLYGDHVSCYAGKGTLWIDWQGNLLPCSMLSMYAVSLKEKELEVAWEDLKESVTRIKTCGKCMNCKHRKICRVCAGSMCIESGSTTGCPDYICEVTNAMIRIAKEHITTGRVDFKGENR